MHDVYLRGLFHKYAWFCVCMTLLSGCCLQAIGSTNTPVNTSCSMAS